MQKQDTYSDDELLRLSAAGDEGAFVTLYRRLQQSIYRFALQMSGSEAIAEDVTQEVFLTLLENPERYDAKRGPLAAFLYGIARNHVLRRLQKERWFSSLPDAENETANGFMETNLISNEDPLCNLTRGEAIKEVQQAVLSLPPHYREAVVLCDMHELSYAEAAAIVDCAIGTMRSRLHRGRGLLLKKLRQKKESANASEVSNATRCFA
jgi:RNA polymerase sigma-70 factor (ECF subfamily)